jgi:FecR-like protein
MQQSRHKLTIRAALMASIAAAFPVVAQGAPAARVEFSIGNVAAVNKAGQSRPVPKGAVIEEGETINTNSGRTQLRFTDGAYVSLQPQSEFRIDQYRFEGKQDGSERTFISLLKGGLRTITGLVGRTNKKNYQVATTVATIGIRGTEYTIQYGGSLSGTVGEGEIDVCNGAGCINVTNGESYYVANQDVKPQLSNKGTDLPPPEPTKPPSNFVRGETTDQAGNINQFIAVGTYTVVGGTASAGAATAFQPATVTFGSTGALVSSFPATDVGNDGLVAWGRLDASSTTRIGTGLAVSVVPVFSADPWTHYAVAIRPTTAGDISNLTLSNPVGSYSLIGATTPTVFDSATGTVSTAQLNRASLTAYFAQGTVDAFVNLTWSGKSIDLNGAGMKLSATAEAIFTGVCSTSGASACSMAGAFSGPHAERAALAYGVTFTSTTPAMVSGAAAFSKKP